MKTNLTLLFLLVMMISCQPKKSDSIEMSVAEAAKIDNIEDCATDTVVDLLSFVKKQSPDVEKYIRHHLSKFQVTEKMFEGGYVQPGEQFVQLRCLWGMLKGK